MRQTRSRSSGSPAPLFETNDDHLSFVIMLTRHPLSLAPAVGGGDVTGEVTGEVTDQITDQVIAEIARLLARTPMMRVQNTEQCPMTIESLPNFSSPARQRWASIPADIRQRLLTNVWCGQCRHAVTITNFNGTIRGGDLLLVGKCAECQGDVARVIEGG